MSPEDRQKLEDIHERVIRLDERSRARDGHESRIKSLETDRDKMHAQVSLGRWLIGLALALGLGGLLAPFIRGGG